MNAVLLSVKPEFASRLLSGHKTAEVRRRFPVLPTGTIVYLYASTPVRAVIGTLRLDEVHVDTPATLWRRFGKRLDIAKEYFTDYLSERESAVVVALRTDERWEHVITLDELRKRVGMEPPQSFRYLTPAQELLLRDGLDRSEPSTDTDR